MVRKHPTAVVDPTAHLDDDVEVGPYSIIGPRISIGKGTRIKSHVVIEGNTSIGRDNLIYQFATVGSSPQDRKYEGEDSRLIIGDGNTIREFTSLNPGTAGGGMVTRIGQRNLLMMQCHVAHDCIFGDDNIVANGAMLGGHVTVGNHVIIGALAGIHQFRRHRHGRHCRRGVHGVQGRAALLQRNGRPRAASRTQSRGPQAARL